MARPAKRIVPLTREARPARRMTGVHPRIVAAELYELHAAANRGEDYLADWPGDSELYGVLVFAQAHAGRLKDQGALQQAALYRIQLAEWLREQADPLQLQAIDDARAAATAWERIALVLGFVQRAGETATPLASSAWKRARRLRVAVHGGPEDRRQPEVAQVIETRAVQEELLRRERERVEDIRYPAMDRAARALLHHFRAGDLLVDADDGFWWGELAEAVDDRQSVSERATLVVYVRGAVRETFDYAVRTGQAPALTDEAAKVLRTAAALVDLADKASRFGIRDSGGPG
ncbi:hypothetical protein ABT224_33560 [Streptomyces sp. NPDC001584]|uniref:hypothetical protein n=1 Tax=Streptomyces sp. NPDC001584 TaxID=3154521 RepID=UPI00332F7764